MLLLQQQPIVVDVIKQPPPSKDISIDVVVGMFQMAGVVLKDRPIVYLFHRHWLWAYTAKLSGFRTMPDGLVRMQGLKFN